MLVLQIEENAYTNNLIACLSRYVMSIGQRETSKRLGAIPAFNAMSPICRRHFDFTDTRIQTYPEFNAVHFQT